MHTPTQLPYMKFTFDLALRLLIKSVSLRKMELPFATITGSIEFQNSFGLPYRCVIKCWLYLKSDWAFLAYFTWALERFHVPAMLLNRGEKTLLWASRGFGFRILWSNSRKKTHKVWLLLLFLLWSLTPCLNGLIELRVHGIFKVIWCINWVLSNFVTQVV